MNISITMIVKVKFESDPKSDCAYTIAVRGKHHLSRDWFVDENIENCCLRLIISGSLSPELW